MTEIGTTLRDATYRQIKERIVRGVPRQYGAAGRGADADA